MEMYKYLCYYIDIFYLIVMGRNPASEDLWANQNLLSI